ncbi:TrkH family potassium uptake protein [Gammaproteobacteria bacterium]|nr:TrkH family potassium uptake protein [Gammaproteobacteria bacterium]MDA7856764.1 TrkH family potassium uptake protein [Gammaproteobacteria bacterium]MDA8856422.1 TrkH family potassium uptake protein [Gammaproteobacteria bacterium]MDA9010625.1 TrkH family potassium uptake protein [Gammaproteobacteria bacterium]MDA9024416.1 TrkH family potassium uptake protein [Gammaproteobacteria bacterium]
MALKPIINLFSVLVMLFSASLLAPISISFIFKDGAEQIFITTLVVAFVPAFLAWLLTRKSKEEMGVKDGFVIITLFWVVLSFVGSIPFTLSGMSFIDSFFESMSGITTTGATVISGLDLLPESILFYRQMLQWMGGMGLIVLAIAVMPLLGIGGGQLFKTEIPGALSDQKLTPRIKETAQALWLIYLTLTLVCAGLYYLAGMTGFDAISHSLSTVSIGGFSTHDESIGFFNSFSIEVICMIFMLLSAFSYALHYFAIYKKRPIKYFHDAELRFFISILSFVIILSIFFCYILGFDDASIRQIFFQSISIVTTTGFISTDYSSWPTVITFLLLVGAFIGACSGSVGGGIKSWRVLIMINHAKINIMRLVHPNAVVSLKIGTKAVDDKVAESVWGFFSIYIISFMLLLLSLLATGMDFESAFSAIGACLNNLGPGLGSVSETYSSVTGFGKGILAFAMILGRLEIFTLLVLFTTVFWDK